MVEMLLALFWGAIDSRDRLRDQTAEWMRSFMRVRIFGNFDPENHRDPISLVSLVVVTGEWCKRTTIVKMVSWWCFHILCVLIERLDYRQFCMEVMERLDYRYLLHGSETCLLSMVSYVLLAFDWR